MQIFDSYIDAGQHLPQDERQQYYTALVEYLAYGIDPQIEGAALAIFTAIRPSLEESRKRQINGRKGGKARKTEKQPDENRESKTTEIEKAKPPKSRKQNSDFPKSKTAIFEKAKPEKTEKQNPVFLESKTPEIEKANSNSSSNVQEEKEKNKKEKEERHSAISSIVAHLNEQAGTAYRPTSKKTRRLIEARLREGFSEQDFYAVIDAKCTDWLHNTKMRHYLRPETLFGTKFEGYLNAPSTRDPPNPQVDFSIYDVDITEISSEDLIEGGDYVTI